MNKRQILTGILSVSTLFALGCEATQTTATAQTKTPSHATATTSQAEHHAQTSPYDKAGFTTFVEDGRLWVLKPGEKASEKHISLIGAGPAGMTVRALNKKTALEYLTAKDGFETEIEDGRLWVLQDGQKKAEKHISLIGVGPRGMTILAQDKNTVLAYLAEKPGFETVIKDGRLWVLRDGQKESEKHISLIGAGPMGVTVKALDKSTALEYLVSTPGFETVIKDGRLWVLKNGQKESEKHITLIGAGPMGMTLKALDRQTANAYLAAVKYTSRQ